MVTTIQSRFTWFRRMTAMECVLLILGIVFITLLILGAVIIASMLLHKGKAIMVNSLFAEIDINVLVACISGALLAITLVYQVIQFRLSRFQTIFHHQMELHLGLVDKMEFKKRKGNKAIKTLAAKLEKKMNKRKGTACHRDIKQIMRSLKPIMQQFDYMLTPYFRHITSVLSFLKYRSPHSESKAYPDYYLNIFSKCELRLFFFYAVWEQKQIDKRKIQAEGCSAKPRKSETNMRQLLKVLEFDRYFLVAFSEKDATWQKLYSDFVNP